jgi:hypothetical protein
MGIREPGALTKAIDQMRTDLAESSDPELRTTYVDFDSLLVVLESAREMARHEVAMEWLRWGQGGDDVAIEQASIGLLSALDDLDQPFEHGMPPCGDKLNDGVVCELFVGHAGDHKADTGEQWVPETPPCGAQREAFMPDDTANICSREAGHGGHHRDSLQGESW